MNPRLFIETSRLTLRLPHPEDVGALHVAITESMGELESWLPLAEQGQTLSQTRDFVYVQMGRWVTGEALLFGMFDKIKGACVGAIDLSLRERAVASYEVGFWVRSGVSGQGYVTEALEAVTGWAFEVLKAQRLYLECDGENLGCQRVAEKVGYVREECTTKEGMLAYGHTPMRWQTGGARTGVGK